MLFLVCFISFLGVRRYTCFALSSERLNKVLLLLLRVYVQTCHRLPANPRKLGKACGAGVQRFPPGIALGKARDFNPCSPIYTGISLSGVRVPSPES